MEKITLGFALTGSYCTFGKVIPEIRRIVSSGYKVIPIMSENVYLTDTRFGKASFFREELLNITGNEIISNIKDAEPIGPKNLLDALIIAPCTGNTLAKLSSGIADTSVTMGAKAILRNEKPVIVAVSTNDGLGNACKNIGNLLNYKNYYFVPFNQDSPDSKPRSVVADMKLILPTLEKALKREQIQPLIYR